MGLKTWGLCQNGPAWNHNGQHKIGKDLILEQLFEDPKALWASQGSCTGGQVAGGGGQETSTESNSLEGVEQEGDKAELSRSRAWSEHFTVQQSKFSDDQQTRGTRPKVRSDKDNHKWVCHEEKWMSTTSSTIRKHFNRDIYPVFLGIFKEQQVTWWKNTRIVSRSPSPPNSDHLEWKLQGVFAI
jgi:hypothetical protein